MAKGDLSYTGTVFPLSTIEDDTARKRKRETKNISDNRNFLSLPKGEVLFQHNQSPKLPPRLLRIGEKKSSAYARRRRRKRGAGPLKGQIPGGRPPSLSPVFNYADAPTAANFALVPSPPPSAKSGGVTCYKKRKYQIPLSLPLSRFARAGSKEEERSIIPPPAKDRERRGDLTSSLELESESEERESVAIDFGPTPPSDFANHAPAARGLCCGER